MKQVIYHYRSEDDLRHFLKANTVLSEARKTAVSSLIQIYASPNASDLTNITTILLADIPDAVIVGASSVGEIADNAVFTEAIVIIFSLFKDTHLYPFSMLCQEEKERSLGESLGRVISAVSDISSILLLTTAHSLNTSALLAGLKEKLKEQLIFGGGASEYAHAKQNWILHHKRIIHRGVVAVAFASKSLQIKAGLSSGWRPFGNKKTITDTDGLKIVTIDHKPADEVLQQYVETVKSDLFSKHASVFALMLERENRIICRVPMLKDKYGAIQFAADIYPNETFRLGIGDPELMLQETHSVAKTLQEFRPEGIFIFACGIRLMLLQNNAELETHLFSNIAPSAGFYTSGEILKPAEENELTSLYNTCLLAVGFREQEMLDATTSSSQNGDEAVISLKSKYQYEQRHAKVIANLLRFVQAVTNELEETNQALLNQSITDKLTGLFNRVELDRALAKEIDRSKRYGTPMSVFILDIDNFKLINDQFGHIVGDNVLIEIAKILKTCVRTSDTVGRWGGEEFLIILPHTDADSAFLVAEKMRKTLGNKIFDMTGKQTASFGIATCNPTDDIKTLLAKADSALYLAKHSGKNQVVIFRETQSPKDIFGFLRLNWKSQYECLNETLNNQHKKLMSGGTSLINALIDQQPEQELYQLVDELIADLTEHFNTEEKIFEKTEYPEAKIHKAHHQQILAKATQLNEAFKQSKISIRELLSFIIHDTISEHFLKADQGFFAFIDKEP